MKSILLFTFFFLQSLFISAAEPAKLTHNTLEEIEACKGNLKLKLVRTWGGDQENDENKFFRFPQSMVIDGNGMVHICDTSSHCIKVFNMSGKLSHTIGRRGRGPGDVYEPYFITIPPNGGILVYEHGGRRLQWFQANGKSKKILKIKGLASWIEITSKNEIAIYDSFKTLYQRKLVYIINSKGKVLRKFGTYHDKSKNYIESDKLKFAMDNNDFIYAANEKAPVVRKYSDKGELMRVITFEPAYGKPLGITLNSKGDEIEIHRKDEPEGNVEIKGKNGGVTIQYKKNKKKEYTGGIISIGIDDQKRIYIVTNSRPLKEKEIGAGYIYGSPSNINRSKVNYDILENIDIYRMVVFAPNGKVIAEAQMTTLCDNIYIHENKIFVIDGLVNQRILEYEMSFANKVRRSK